MRRKRRDAAGHVQCMRTNQNRTINRFVVVLNGTREGGGGHVSFLRPREATA